jgi:ornithine cyclodeaminase
MTIRILSAADVRAAIDPRRAIDAMRSAFGQLSSGDTEVPLRGQLESAAGATLIMPAYLKRSHELGVKIVSIFPDNADHGLQIIQGAVVLLDAGTGAPIALMDGSELTACRTAAGSALATELLASPGASVLALFGAGVQARAHVWALAAVRSLREIRVVSRSGATAERLAAELASPTSERGPAAPTIRAVDDPRVALRDADLIVAATTSHEPVFEGCHVERGAHINAVGSFRPHMQEVDAETVVRARVVVDSRDAAWEEAGDLIVPLREGLIDDSHIAAELGEIVNGASPQGREGRDITLFKSVGNAAQDIAMASAVVAAAEELGLGRTVAL